MVTITHRATALHAAQTLEASRPLLQLVLLNGLCDLVAWLLVPALAMAFASHDLPAAVVGVCVGLPWIALVVSLPVALRLVARFGPLCTLRAGLTVQIIALAWMAAQPSVAGLVIGAALFGLGMGPCWVLPDCWLVRLAPPRTRGRWLGIYEAVNGLAIGGGPLLLAIVVTFDLSVLLVAALVLVASLLSSIALPVPAGLGGQSPRLSRLLALVRLEPALVLCALLAGIVEGGAIGMLPAFGDAAGLDPTMAMSMLAAVGVGSIAVQVPVGSLCDEIGAVRARDACLVALVASLAATAIPGLGMMPMMGLCFVWGGIAGALYTCALADAGQRLQGDALMLAIIVMMVGYIVGCGLGPVLGGMGLDVEPRSGLFVSLALPVVVVTIFLVGPRMAKGGALQEPDLTP